jgi:hypothetical protein
MGTRNVGTGIPHEVTHQRGQERETGGLGRGAKWDSGYQTTDPEGTARKMVIRRK